MGISWKLGTPIIKSIVKILESTDSLIYFALQHADTVAQYIVVSYSTNSLTKSEFVIAKDSTVDR